jgi:hypothetical protein
MNFEQKYLKYKEKYLQLKKLNGGNPLWKKDYYYHGTSSVFLPFIKKYGLGRFPDELYLPIKEIYNYSRNMDFPETDKINKYKVNSPLYIDPNWGTKVGPNGQRFITNMRRPDTIYIGQKKLRDTNLYDVYFAKDIINAKAYGRNGRLGDSQITFLSNLREWFERNKQNVEITSNPIWKTVNNLIAILDPPNKKQIILAIKNTSLKNDTKDDISAFVNSRLIKPSELYVYHEEPTNNDFDEVIPLLSYKL